MNETKKQKTLRGRWGIFVLALGALVIASSIYFLHKPWTLGELVYDIGVAVLIVGLVDVSFLETLKRFASGKTKLEKRLDQERKVESGLQKWMDALEKSLRDANIECLASDIKGVEMKLVELEPGLSGPDTSAPGSSVLEFKSTREDRKSIGHPAINPD